MRRAGQAVQAVMFGALAGALWLMPAAAAQAQASQPASQATTQPTPPDQQDLYLEAIKSIGEGRKTDASEALTRMIAKEPQHAGAWLDLALIQCELGHALEAERLFQAIESRFAPPPGILEVINKQRAIGCAGWQPQRHWTTTLGRGHDQNVNQGASNPNFTIGQGNTRIELQLAPEFLPLADSYTVLGSDYSREITPNGSIGFVQFQARHNDRLSRYNTESLFIGLDQPWRIRQWDVRTSAIVGALSLGGHLYQRQTQLQARITPPLSLPDRWQYSLSVGASYIQYLSLTNFNSHAVDLRNQLAYRSDTKQASASFGFSSDQAAAERPGGNRQGWFASLQGRALIKDNIAGELSWTRQTWRGQAIYSPGLIPEKRNQDTQIARAALIIPVTAKHSIQLELRQVSNHENISIFQYSNRQFQMSWQWQN